MLARHGDPKGAGNMHVVGQDDAGAMARGAGAGVGRAARAPALHRGGVQRPAARREVEARDRAGNCQESCADTKR